MSDWEKTALKAKVRVANQYLNQAFKSRGKVDMYDVFKVVTASMRGYVEVADLSFINEYGKNLKDVQFVVIREAV